MKLMFSSPLINLKLVHLIFFIFKPLSVLIKYSLQFTSGYSFNDHLHLRFWLRKIQKGLPYVNFQEKTFFAWSLVE